ncbi:hypothetical protein, partial [Bacillus sp. FJAT-27986]|uniref:hypothetical protein n=1 Tax=Bacillus sp. FJAT-27986 TaxID=1743146 RepID=UPI001C30EB7E
MRGVVKQLQSAYALAMRHLYPGIGRSKVGERQRKAGMVHLCPGYEAPIPGYSRSKVGERQRKAGMVHLCPGYEAPIPG